MVRKYLWITIHAVTSFLQWRCQFHKCNILFCVSFPFLLNQEDLLDFEFGCTLYLACWLFGDVIWFLLALAFLCRTRCSCYLAFFNPFLLRKFANFYHCFIKGFSKIVQPLTALTRKDRPFCWTLAEQFAFMTLKSAFMIAPILLHPDPTKPFIVETDASDFVIGVILSQPDNDGVHHPVAYYSRKFTAPEINYPIYEK